MLNNDTNARRPLMLSENSELLRQRIEEQDETPTPMPPYAPAPPQDVKPIDLKTLTVTIKPL